MASLDDSPVGGSSDGNEPQEHDRHEGRPENLENPREQEVITTDPQSNSEAEAQKGGNSSLPPNDDNDNHGSDNAGNPETSNRVQGEQAETTQETERNTASRPHLFGDPAQPEVHTPSSSLEDGRSKGTAIETDLESQRRRWKRFGSYWRVSIDVPGWHKWIAYYIPILEWLPKYHCMIPFNMLIQCVISFEISLLG
jgi:hypothetical protein